MAERLEVVAIGGSRIGELDGHIGRSELRRVEIVLVVDIDNTYNLVAALTGNLFYHVPHLTVADKCYFHILLTVCSVCPARHRALRAMACGHQGQS